MAESRIRARAMDIWLARGAVFAIVALQFLIVNDLTFISRWILPSLELALLVPLSIATAWSLGQAKSAVTENHWYEVTQYGRVIRRAFLFLTGLVSAANLITLVGLVQAMLGGHAADGKTLLLDSLNIWITNVIIFSLWYWNLDRGGAAVRSFVETDQADFLFTQQTVPQPEGAPPFSAGYIDYLFLAFTNATAFSPADTYPLTPRAKVLMMLEAMISLVTIALVASRAVGILS